MRRPLNTRDLQRKANRRIKATPLPSVVRSIDHLRSMISPTVETEFDSFISQAAKMQKNKRRKMRTRCRNDSKVKEFFVSFI